MMSGDGFEAAEEDGLIDEFVEVLTPEIPGGKFDFLADCRRKDLIRWVLKGHTYFSGEARGRVCRCLQPADNYPACGWLQDPVEKLE